ncbi:hypothetical protein [Planotetraspora sp. GP83]|uniref:hypothetical protein n=1 Tax=Planotetraspora sp. GP83 TaxID=3156264 RepID=UPI0035135B72
MPHRRAPRHTRPDAGLDLNSRGVRIGLGAVVTLVISGALLAARSGAGARFLAEAQAFLTFYAGVFSLLALTTTVALGLAATDRIVLPIPHRVRAQLVHRAAALIGVGFLVTHIGMKIATGLVPAYGSVVPTTSVYVGMGALASDLMIVVVATGVMRGRFAQAERPWTWRILHDLAYLAWPLSVLHGLVSGRTPAAWVSWSYVVCLVAVGSALLLRVVAAARPAAAVAPAEERDARRARTLPTLSRSHGQVARLRPRTAPRTTPQPASEPVAQPVGLLGRTGTDAVPIGSAHKPARKPAHKPQDTRLRRIV